MTLASAQRRPKRARRPGPLHVAAAAPSTAVSTAEWVVAATTVFCLGMKTSLTAGITVGTVLGILLAPVWVPEIRRRGRTAIVFFALAGICVASGLALTLISSTDHIIAFRQIIAYTALLAQFVVGAGVLWWAQRPLGIRAMGVIFGLGVFLQSLLTGAAAAGNPWKNLFAVPVAMIVLSLSYQARRWIWDAVLLFLLGVISSLNDSRSYAATFLIALVLVLWQRRPRAMTRRASSWLTGLLIAAVGFGVYRLGQALLVAGYLGANAQARTIMQIRQAGSLIYGGRPELKATLALMHDDVWGHGLGVLPNFHDLVVAKSALRSVIYNPNNGYVEHYMFGNDIELHSVFGDLWTHFGLAGLAMVVLISAIALRAIVAMVAQREASGLVLFLGAWSLWNVLFSPFYSALTQLILLVAVVVAPTRETSEPAAAVPPAHDGGERDREPLGRSAQHRK